MLKRCGISRSNASGLVCRLVMNRWQAMARGPFLAMVVVMNSEVDDPYWTDLTAIIVNSGMEE
jgi:hypothetical protein